MLHTPRKRFGQHFLTDRHYLERIVKAIAPNAGESMVEIGPGPGALTEHLAQAIRPLHVVEIDRDLAGALRERFTAEQVVVHEGDALEFDFSQLRAPLRVVGNLPYNISTPILFHVATFADRLVDCTFMLQKEVVDRMAAAPSSKDYGRLSVMLQWRYDIESVLDVPPESFDPPPRVDSAVVRMLPLPDAPGVEPALLSELVRVAFSQRRKLLRHTLGRWLTERGFAGEFDVQRRAEEVPVADYLALAAALK
jgi:16S rRNA (adenine1518-N6/adenine1519-N6)-dimethyltransferase